jgi:predicted methyltransferase
MDVDVVVAEVASAVGLAEGPAGVRDVLRVIAHHEPVAAREVGRLAELPVPIVAAVCNELRKRGVVDRSRPVRLTPAGRAGLALPADGHPPVSGECPGCGGTGVTVPAALATLAGELELAAAGGVTIELIDHDLRQPLPAGLAGAFDVACTDPPYTVAGAELFLSRAVAALAGGPGSHVFFSFGARRPEETLRVQRLIADLGLTVRSLVPGFNSYTGAGVLAGVSHLYHLRTTAQARPAIAGAYTGPLYTADTRAAVTRPYRCAGCGAVHQVGPGARWSTVARLKAAGCPDCGGTVLRPMALGQAGARPAAGR